MVGNNFSVLACRVCLSLENNKVIMGTTNGWLELFKNCFGLEIYPNEKARALCEQCAESIRSFALLKVKCWESDKVWKSRLKASLKNEVVTLEADHEEYLTEFADLKKINSIKIKNENDTFSMASSCDKTIFSIEQFRECSLDGINQKEIKKSLHCAVSIEKCENDVMKCNTGNISIAKEDMRCECGIQKIDNRRKFNMHRKTCFLRKFFNLPQNSNDILKSCGLCDFTTQYAKVLCQHFDEHYKKNDLECKLCDYTGHDFADMAFHRYKHMPTDMSKLYCLKCFKSFISPKGLQFHFRVMHLKKEKGGLCFCGTTFTTVKKWTRHEKRIHHDLHKDSKVFICDCCGLKFLFRCDILTHLRYRAGLTKVVCDECGAVFSRPGNLKLHIKNKHTNIQRIKCPKCPKALSAGSLQNHIKRVHGDKNFFCELCSAAYTTLKSLKYHMLDHTKERPHHCGLCKASYKNKSHLTVHMRKHTGERPYVCSICYKAFPSLNRLKVHNTVHTNLRRFQCEHCNRSYHSKKQFMEHCAKAHPVLPDPGSH